MPPNRPPDAISKWLVITRAAVFSMTVTSGLIGGLLAVGAQQLRHEVTVDWGKPRHRARGKSRNARTGVQLSFARRGGARNSARPATIGPATLSIRLLAGGMSTPVREGLYVAPGSVVKVVARCCRATMSDCTS